MTKLICFGDLHLGQGSAYGRKPGERLADQDAVLDRIADLAIERKADGILCAGDVFDGPGIPPEQLDVFARFVGRCHGAGIPILSVVGNGIHDAAVRSTNGLAIFSHIDGIEIASMPDVYAFAGCAVATLPWVSPARLVAARNGGDRDEINAEVAQLLIDIAARGKEDCERIAPGAPHILLGHWSVSGAALPTGLPTDTLREPVIPSADLDALGFDHIVLGHIHHGQAVGERGFYVGSPLPLNFGEQDDSHGVVILHTDETQDVDYYAAEFVPISSRRFVTIDFDCTDETQARWLEAATEHPSMIDPALVEDAIVRLRITATSAQMRRINTPALTEALISAGAHVVKLDPHTVHESRARVTVERPDEITEAEWLDRWLDVSETPEDARADVRAVFGSYVEGATA